ncbi:MAG: ATP-grasp domain-containing protein [Chitinispirillaceae bacterium]|nr:ATP-grasp domain-containing protein [Chitinispirillaceae bacterium]
MAFRLFYFNPLFDLELGDIPHEKVATSARQMSVLFALMGDASDRVLLDAEPLPEYWDYLDENGIDHCAPVREKEDLSQYQAVAWGWNRQAVDRLKGLGARCVHPDLSVVKTVNSRAWCAALNRATETGVPGTRSCTTSEEVTAACKALQNRFPLVIKPRFGASGHGFIKITTRESLSGALHDRVRLLCEAGGCIVEPWLERTRDLSSSGVINRDGSFLDMTHYECRVTVHGVFYGVVLRPERLLIDRCHTRLERAVQSAAGMLAHAGYFGPAGFDSFLYRDNASGKEMLAPIVEINARQVMSALARVLYDKTGRSGHGYLRLFGRKKITLPEHYAAVYDCLGDDRYDPATGRGILLVSPLRFAGSRGEVRPARSVFYISARNAPAVQGMDARLQQIFQPDSQE